MRTEWGYRLIGVIFLLAAIYRILFLDAARYEVSALGLPAFSIFVIIAAELAIGIMLVIDYRRRTAAWIAVAFLAVAIIIALIGQWGSIFADGRELFVFNPTPTDVLLHAMYVVILLIILDEKKHWR